MVRNYIKKKLQNTVDEARMKRAISDIVNNRENNSFAARKYNLKRTTIITRLKRHRKQNRLRIPVTPANVLKMKAHFFTSQNSHLHRS